MENELTHYQNLADNVFRESMEEIQENLLIKEAEKNIVIDEDGPDPLLEGLENPTEGQKYAAKKWGKILKQKQERGRELTKEEKEIARKAIERGELPLIAGGSGDGKLENFPSDKYKGTIFEDIANKVKRAGENNAVDGELLAEIKELRNQAAALGHEGLSNDFIRDFNVAQRGQENQTASIKDLLQRRLDLAAEKKERRSANPQSIQELAQVIINEEGDEVWGPDGIYPLLEIIRDKNGNPMYRTDRYGEYIHDENQRLVPQLEVNQKNLMKWFRERMIYFHTNNARDSKFNMTGSVGIVNEYGSKTNIYTMDEQKGTYFRDENTGTIYKDLSEQMKAELWLFGNMRNYDLMYQEAMGSDSELPKLLNGIHNLEEITRPGSLELIMTLARNHGEIGDTEIGDGIRKAYEIYFNISDFSELQKILGRDSSFFKREGFVKALKIIEKKMETATEEDLSKDGRDLIERIFSKDGELDPSVFVRELNPFNAKNKPEFNIKVVRELVRLVISEKYGFDYGLQYSPEKKINEETKKVIQSDRTYHRNDLEYAETWAWVLTRWTGAAARNDTGAIGFDALTKAMKVLAYRIRQSDASRAGAFGNEYDLPVLKSLISDFFNGIFVEKSAVDGFKNITPYEVFGELDKYDKEEEEIRRIRGGRSDNELTEEEKAKIIALKKEKMEWADRLKFEQFTQRGFLSDHVNRGFEVFHSIIGADEMHLEEIVKWDPFRGVIMDRGKFEEQVKEKFLKPLRYEFSTYDKIDFSKKTRIQTGVDKETGLPIYKEVTNAEKFFGPEVLNEVKLKAYKHFRKQIEHGEMTHNQAWEKYLTKEGRSQLWKQAAMMRLAAHIRSHRQFGNGYTPFTAGMVDMFYDALSGIKAMEIYGDEYGTSIESGARFLSEEDIEWIRKYSGTTERSLFLKDFLLKETGGGVAKGVWSSFGMFFKEVFR